MAVPGAVWIGVVAVQGVVLFGVMAAWVGVVGKGAVQVVGKGGVQVLGKGAVQKEAVQVVGKGAVPVEGVEPQEH